MYWQEKTPDQPFQVPDDIVDLSFNIDCRCLPLDHAHALSQALHQALPWLEAEQNAGIHAIHGAASGNGWYRPEDPINELLQVSRRTRMTLRLPKARVKEAEGLIGQTLDIAGYPLTLGKASIRKLSPLGTLFSRYVIAAEEQSEEHFMDGLVTALEAMGIAVRRMMCGKTHRLSMPEGARFTRSVMIADLAVEDSIRLQQQGLGSGRKLGCGLFIPHKGIDPVGQKDDA